MSYFPVRKYIAIYLNAFQYPGFPMTRFLAPFFALTALAAALPAHAETDAADATRRLVGTCIVVQAARLDNGRQTVDVLSKAVAAGCLSRLRTAIALDNDMHPQLANALARDDASDAFDVQDTLSDMAASAIAWLRGPGALHVPELRGNNRIVAAR
jgi:hypothetical protein